jgi:hypothetical protein
MKRPAFKPEDKFISVSVFKFPLGNCGGVTDHLQTIFIPSERGNYKFEELELDKVFYPEQRAPEYWALHPYITLPGYSYMSGGNLAYCSDSRCERVYHIHDRKEAYSNV